MCAGYYIHSYSDFQDVRSISSISYFSPIISFFFFCSSISLCGFPFLSGFYSKDIILEILLIRNYNFLIFILVLFSTIFTLTYSLRLFYFISFFNLGKKTLMSFRDERFIYLPMSLLFFITTVGGRLITWLLFPTYFIYLSFLTKTLVLIFLSLFLFMLTVSFSLKLNIFQFSKKIIYFFRNIWNLPFMSTSTFIKRLYIGLFFLKHFDQGWVELYGPQGIFKNFLNSSRHETFNSSVNIKNFLLFFFFTFLFFLVII